MALLVVDPNVFVSGLIAEGTPAEVVDLVRYGEVRVATCPQLLAELEGVLLRPRFRRYVDPDEVHAYLGLLRAITLLQPDPSRLEDVDCRDPNDAYLIGLARQVGADALVSGDRDLTSLDNPNPPVLTPSGALVRYDPVPRQPFAAVSDSFEIVMSGPKSGERRVHRALQAAGFVTDRTSGTEQRPSVAWVRTLSHSGDRPSPDYQRSRLDRAQAVGDEEGYRLRRHGVVVGGPTELRVVLLRSNRQELFRLFADDLDRALEQLARQLGLQIEDLAVEDAPGTWELPESP